MSILKKIRNWHEIHPRICVSFRLQAQECVDFNHPLTGTAKASRATSPLLPRILFLFLVNISTSIYCITLGICLLIHGKTCMWKRSGKCESCSVVSDSVHVILQASLLEWVAFPFSTASSKPRDQTRVSHIAGGFFTSWATREAQEYWCG